MEQAILVRALYRACLDHDTAKQRELLHEETKMVLKHREQGGGAFGGEWTVVSGTCSDVEGSHRRMDQN